MIWQNINCEINEITETIALMEQKDFDALVANYQFGIDEVRQDVNISEQDRNSHVRELVGRIDFIRMIRTEMRQIILRRKGLRDEQLNAMLPTTGGV